MDAKLGWALAVAVVALGWLQYGWQGVALATSCVVFWLLLQFTRALRAMRVAGTAPVGTVPSAVMLHARLKKGLRLIDLIQRPRSLGQRLDAPGTLAEGADEAFTWTDTSGASVQVQLKNGRVTEWQLLRPAEATHVADGPPGP